MDVVSRFERKNVEVPWSGCWIWIGAVSTDRKGKMRPTFWVSGRWFIGSRWAYETFRGPIPAGQLVCHSCDVGLCVNPDHLWLGTQRDNIQDMLHKKRGVYRPLRGAANPNAKLSDDLVMAIRKEYAAGGIRQTDLAAKYGIGQSQVSRIIRRESRNGKNT